jgi:Big-like domain-containing protein/SH3 domain-containing protein
VNDTTPPTGGITILPSTTATVAIGVSWRAKDVGSGVKSYSVQVHDRSTSTWAPWLTGTAVTSGTFNGQPGHAYDFRMAATDYKGNVQPWLASPAAPGTTLAIGGFGRTTVDSLNVRTGAGTGFATIDQLSSGALVAVLGGPIAAGGYQWYQVQFDFTEWPSADYPRTGWVAAGSGATAYLVPAKPPNMVTVSASALPAPSVAYRSPAPNATGVATTVTPTVRFDRVVTGVSTSSFLLKKADTPTEVGTVTSAGDGLTFTFHPASALVKGATYTVKLSSAIKGTDGVSLNPTSWSFTVTGGTTATYYDPAAKLVFKMGTHTAYQFSSTGVMQAVKSYTLPNDQNANTSVRKTISNQSGTWFYIVNGVWAGMWMRASDVLYLKT